MILEKKWSSDLDGLWFRDKLLCNCLKERLHIFASHRACQEQDRAYSLSKPKYQGWEEQLSEEK